MHQLSWQTLLANGVRNLQQLLDILELDPADAPLPLIDPVEFPIRAPKGFVAKIKKRDWNDPLLLQLLPLALESRTHKDFSLDPVGDLQAVRDGGILQKYAGRALIMTTGKCAIHCRYCFRRHFPYHEHQPIKDEWQNTIQTLVGDTTLNEVILSGGDPLSLADARLRPLCDAIAKIPHIKRLRLHTRYPLVLPQRITDEFANWFGGLPVQSIMVIHANHANEFCRHTAQTLRKLHRNGVIMLNQSVLLRGVNDSVEALQDLSEALMANSVLPYYLHCLDRVAGSAHFEAPDSKALELIRMLRESMPGYMVPKLVREISGKRSKTPVV